MSSKEHDMERADGGELRSLLVAVDSRDHLVRQVGLHAEVSEQLQLPLDSIPDKQMVFGKSIPVPVDNPLRPGLGEEEDVNLADLGPDAVGMRVGHPQEPRLC